MERKRPAGSVLKSTGATVLSGPKSLAGDPRAAAPSAPALSELTKSTGKLPEGRTRSSSRQLVDLGLKADDRHEKSSRAELNAKDLPGVPSALNEPLVEHLPRAERPAVPAAAPAVGSRGWAMETETEDDLDALLKGLDAPSPVSADPSLNPTRAETQQPAVAKTSESCTSCGKAFEAGQNIYESSLTGEKQILCGACWSKQAPHCVACGEEISGTMAKVGEDIYHQNCLKCTQCRKPIDGQLTKMDCGLVCGSCSQDIEREIQELRSLLAEGDETGAALIIGGLKGRGINPPEVSQGDLGHCSGCQRGFKAGQQVYESPDGKTLCEACYWCYWSSAPKCSACGTPVVGTVAQVAENTFHPDCLVCSSCKQKLTGAFVKTDAGFLCSECRK